MPLTPVFAEDFERPNWEDDWNGRPLNGYPVNQGSDDDREVRILFRENEHYGTDYRSRDLGSMLRGAAEFDLYLSGDWNPAFSGKLPGVLDTNHEPYGYGNNKPSPEGFSIRTWFGYGQTNRYVGAYVYHAGQMNTYGDHYVIGKVPMWKWVRVRHEWDLTDPENGTVKSWLHEATPPYTQIGFDSIPVRVGHDTAPNVFWLCGYHGGNVPAPSNMAADIDNVRVVAADPEPVPPATSTSGADLIQMANELRDIADRLEGL